MSIGLILIVFVVWLFANNRFAAWQALLSSPATQITSNNGTASSDANGNTNNGNTNTNNNSFNDLMSALAKSSTTSDTQSVDSNVDLPSSNTNQGSVDITSVKLID
ncbi:MAG: hypothetical protein ACYDAO_09380 [Thermoplasmataceae archaeon]